jgi:LytS/YehU family sensor histidine kinase
VKKLRALEAATIALLCIACAVGGQLVYGNVAWSQRWFHYGDREFFLFDERAATTMRFASRRLETPLLLIALAALIIGRFVVAERQERERELRERRLDARLSEARLHLLRSQLHPHFLFNALNSVMAMVHHDAYAAAEMLARLSRFYEITANTEGRAWIALGEEIGFAREYLEIEQIRFGARLTVDIAADADTLAARVPALLLQPLVENAVKHGVAKTPGPVWIRLRTRRDGAGVHMEVENRGTFDPAGSGVGLQNTRERLRQAYGDGFTLRIVPERDSTRVVVAVEAA